MLCLNENPIFFSNKKELNVYSGRLSIILIQKKKEELMTCRIIL